MDAKGARGALIMAERSGLDGYKRSVCEYVRRACLAVAAHIEDFLPDGVYCESPGEVTIHLPIDGAASIEVRTETFVLNG